jgi:hypothetical protein
MGKPSASNIIAKSPSAQEEIAKAFADVRKINVCFTPESDICSAN